MTRDVERLLRRVAKRDSPNPAHYRELRSLLQDRIAATSVMRRRVRRAAVAVAVVCLLAIAATSWRDVGTDDFDVTLSPSSRPGVEFYVNPLMQRSHTIALHPDTLMAGERRRQLAEEILLKSEASEGTLFAIDGSTVDGVTALGATYAIDTAEGRREVTQDLAVPFAQGKRLPFPDPPTRFHMAYGYAKRVRLTEEPGAQYLGRFEFMVDGRLAYCDRWRVPVPGFGNVIIWLGAPYPS